MREPVHIPRPKHKTPSQLKRIHTKLMLSMSDRSRSFAALKIISPENMQHIANAQFSNPIRPPLFIYQQWKVYPSLFLKYSRVISVA